MTRLTLFSYAFSLAVFAVLYGCAHPASPPAPHTQPAKAENKPPAPSAKPIPEPEPLRCPAATEAPREEELRFDWERKLNTGHPNLIRGLVGVSHGVVIAGMNQFPKLLQPVVTRLDEHGRVQWQRVIGSHFPSTAYPPRGVVMAIAAGPSDETFTLATSVGNSTDVYLTKLDGAGHEQWAIPTDFTAMRGTRLATDPDGNVVAVGESNDRGPMPQLLVSKYGVDGAVLWNKRFPYDGQAPFVTVDDQGFIALATSLDRGFADFGSGKLTHDASLRWHCEGSSEMCVYDYSNALLLVGLDARGGYRWSRLVGTANNSLKISSFARTSSGTLAVTGEFYGPPLRVGDDVLCELQAGMPPSHETLPMIHEGVWHPDPCGCTKDERDLFALTFSSDGTPLRARTLAVGHLLPAVTSGAGDHLLWGALTWSHEQGSRMALLELMPDGQPLRQRTATSDLPFLISRSLDGSIYLATEKLVRRVSERVAPVDTPR